MANSRKYIHDTNIHHSKDAEHIVPFIIKLFNPASVLDVGCGLGHFLMAFIDSGISDVTGIEGEWLDKSKLVIDENVVQIKDLEKPFHLERKFDIALCLEVAEHLSENAAEQLIASLTAHSDVIIFSAAIPEQGGQNHINEQWINYWELLFNKRGYKLYDIIRPFIWNIPDIFWWYRQNIIVCINSTKEVNFKTPPVNNYIHPELYLSKIHEINALKEALVERQPDDGPRAEPLN
jgi:SAM-dependent methyltransferase